MLDNHTLIVLGATGDLTGRLLLPALARLRSAGELPEHFAFVGAGPQPWDRAAFREHARTRLAEHAPDLAEADRERFLEMVNYRQVDVLDGPAVAQLLDTHLSGTAAGGRLGGGGGGSEAVSLYLALPTHLVRPTLAAFDNRKLPPAVRIAVEKPFGDGLDSAVELNRVLASVTAGPDSVFRVDHVLGMPTVAQLPTMVAQQRSSATGVAVAEVQVRWDETLALEGRASFYDGAGALKDVLQNHLVQILALVTMHPDEEAGEGDVAQRRLQALRAVHVPTDAEAVAGSRRARYTSGRLATTGGAQGQVVPDYAAEDGVDAGRGTETFAEVVLRVASPPWAGTRFVLRGGKAMGERRRGSLLRFQGPDGVDGSEGRQLWIDVDRPATGPAGGQQTGAGADRGSYRSAPLEQLAYVNVLRCILSGATELSVSAEETELAWRLFTPALEAFAAGTVPLTHYPAGTDPPAQGF